MKKLFGGLLEGEERRCIQRGCEGFAGEGVENRPAVGVQGNGEGGRGVEGVKKADEGLALQLRERKGPLQWQRDDKANTVDVTARTAAASEFVHIKAYREVAVQINARLHSGTTSE